VLVNTQEAYQLAFYLVPKLYTMPTIPFLLTARKKMVKITDDFQKCYHMRIGIEGQAISLDWLLKERAMRKKIWDAIAVYSFFSL
jgi:hypothetical protein